MRSVRVVALAVASICAALALSVSPTLAKDPKWVGPLSQPPLSFGQASIELKIHFGHKSHGSKKLIPKSLGAKERNVYTHCADGTDGYPTDGGTGDATQSSHVNIEETVFVKKNGNFNVTDTAAGDFDTGTFNITGRIHGHSASGTLRMENHRNNGSPPPNDPLTCDSGVLNWTASAP